MPSKFNKSSTNANYNRINESKTRSNLTLEDKKEFQWYDFPFTIICTTFLVVLHFGFWILSPTNVLFSIPPQFEYQFAQINSFIFQDFFSQWYRLFTSIFIHADFFHLAGNLLFFVIFSIRLEELKGYKITAIIFIVSGLVGNIVTLFVFGNILIVSLGASGAINGVFMANLVTMRKTYNKGSLTMLAFLVVFASFTIAGQSSNFFAHAGGLVGGGALMLGFEKLEKNPTFAHFIR